MSSGYATTSAATIPQLVADYLRVLANERAASVHTLRAYQRELNGFAQYIVAHYGLDQPPGNIDHTHIRAYLGTLYDRGLSKASAARALAAIRSWFKWSTPWARMRQAGRHATRRSSRCSMAAASATRNSRLSISRTFTGPTK
jgi:integrase/recombinase XerC